MKSPMPPTGAHFRINISRFMLRAALRYFADSDRSEVESVDMPEGPVHQWECATHLLLGETHDLSYLRATADPPCSSS